MRLARIDSDAENTFVFNSMKGINQIEAWIGGSDTAAQDTWVWVDGAQFWNGGQSGSAVGGLYTDWNNLQPNGANNLQCLGFSQSGNWANLICTDLRPYACEQY